MARPSHPLGLVAALPRVFVALGLLAVGARVERSWWHRSESPTAPSHVAQHPSHPRVQWVDGHCASSGTLCVTDAMCRGTGPCIDTAGVASWVAERTVAPRHNDPAPALMPDVVWNGEGYGVFWIAVDDERSDLWFARVSAAGQRVGRPVRLTNTPTLKIRPDAVWDGSAYAVAYTDLRDDTATGFLLRVGADGAVRGSPWRVAPDAGFDLLPNLVWTGREFAASWYRIGESDGISLRFARWMPDGSRVGPVRLLEPNFLPTGVSSLAYTGDAYGLGYTSFVPRDDRSKTLFVRLGTDGTPSRPVEMAAVAGINGSVSLAWNRRHFGALWEDGIDLPEEDDPTSAIAFGGVSPTGMVVARRLLTDRASLRVAPSLVWNGQEYLAGWTTISSDGLKAEIARVSDAGALVGTPLSLNGRQPGGLPSMVWTGREYGVAWIDARAGDLDVFFTRVGANGARVGSDVQLTAR